MKSMLVIGLGRFGQHLASNLLDLENDVMIIDVDEKKLEGLVPYATSSKIGDCTNPEVLRSLGIGNFDVIFVCIGTNFQSSLEITSLVKEMGGKHVVSKATRDIQAKFLLRNGADEVIYPEKDIAERCAAKYSMDNVFDYIEISSLRDIRDQPHEGMGGQNHPGIQYCRPFPCDNNRHKAGGLRVPDHAVRG